MQDQNFQGAAHASFRFGILSQSLQQTQGLREKGSRWVLSSLSEARAGEDQVFPLTWVRQVVVGRETTGFCPANGCREIAPHQLELSADCRGKGQLHGANW